MSSKAAEQVVKELAEQAKKLAHDGDEADTKDVKALFKQVEEQDMSVQLFKKMGLDKLIPKLADQHNLVRQSKRLLSSKLGENKKGKQTPSQRSSDSGNDSDLSSKKSKTSSSSSKESTKEKDKSSKSKSKEEDSASAASCKFVKAEVLSEKGSPPSRNKKGELVFEDHPEFRPNRSPKQVLEAGAFGGGYFRKIHSRVTGKTYTDAHKEFPSEWFENVDIKTQVANANFHKRYNKYGVDSGSGKEFWEDKGWMSNIDPYGWFQWYCRFFQGRRSTDDERQIGRGNRCFSKTGRWRLQLCNKIMKQNTKYDDASVSPVIRQILLNWGYELTKEDFEQHKKKQASK